MKALGGKMVQGHMELPPDIDGVLETVKKVLKLGGVQSLKMDLVEGLVFERVSSDEDNHPFETAKSYADMPITDIVRQRTVDESPLNGSPISSTEHVIHTFWYMSANDFVVTHIIVGPSTLFWKWLGLDPMLASRLSSFMGAKIEMDKTLGKEKVLFCGARSKTATVDEIEYSIVVHMETPK